MEGVAVVGGSGWRREAGGLARAGADWEGVGEDKCGWFGEGEVGVVWGGGGGVAWS